MHRESTHSLAAVLGMKMHPPYFVIPIFRSVGVCGHLLTIGSFLVFRCLTIIRQKGTQVTRRSIKTINQKYEGQKFVGTEVLYLRKIIEINENEVFEGVFPVFNSIFTVLLPYNLRTATDSKQFRYCTKQLRKQIENNTQLELLFTPKQLEKIKCIDARISGLTWHHNEVPGVMQLVNRNEHNRCRHTGGRKIWGGGSCCR